jgi:hypothetical protein
MLNKHARVTAITARAKKKLRNGLELLRKNSHIQETKKSYTQQLPLSMQLILFSALLARWRKFPG